MKTGKFNKDVQIIHWAYIAKGLSCERPFYFAKSLHHPHTGQSSQLFLDANDGNAQFLATIDLGL